MRLGWSPSTRAGLLGTGTMLPSSHAPLAPHVPPPSPTTQNTEGGGVWAEHLRCPPPRASPSVWGRLRACTDVAGRAASGLGGLDPSWRGASRTFGEFRDVHHTQSHCGDARARCTVAEARRGDATPRTRRTVVGARRADARARHTVALRGARRADASARYTVEAWRAVHPSCARPERPSPQSATGAGKPARRVACLELAPVRRPRRAAVAAAIVGAGAWTTGPDAQSSSPRRSRSSRCGPSPSLAGIRSLASGRLRSRSS
jgi:hypothetical protein